MRGTIRKALMLALTVMLPVLAHAAPITFYFSGSVDYVDQALADSFQLGQQVLGSYTLESTAANTEFINPSAYKRFTGPGAMSAFDFQIGDYSGSLVLPPSGWETGVVVFNDIPYNGMDQYTASGASKGGRLTNGDYLQGAFVWLRDLSGKALSTTDLPVTPPSLDLFPIHEFVARFTPDEGGWSFDQHEVRATLTGLALFRNDLPAGGATATPEPSTMFLMGIGAAGAAFMRRRHKNNNVS